jgi:hypothetical protein
MSVEDINDSLGPAKVDYSEALAHVEPVYIKTQCEVKYGIFGKEAVTRCKNNVYAFCWDECNKEVNVIQNVLD